MSADATETTPLSAVPALCTLREVQPRHFGPNFDPDRASAIIISDKKWVNGTELRYHFLDDPPVAADKKVVRDAFKQWQEVPIGLKLREVADPAEAEIRITFDQTDGSWSYVGRDILSRSASDATMNFGWRLSGWDYGRDTALHEIGHTLGLPHEHQNPKSGIVWNESAVLNYFGGPPNNWSEQQTRWNILRKISPDEVQGSRWDRNSIMHYRFKDGLIDEPSRFQTQELIPAGDLSSRDKQWIKEFYPGTKRRIPELEAFRSQLLDLQPSQQADFVVNPSISRDYQFGTFGESDTVMVLFEDITTGPAESRGLRFVAGDDDSGTDLNARLSAKLFKGRSYVLRVRLYWSWRSGHTAVMMW